MDYENREDGERIVDTDANPEEFKHEVLLRPNDFSEYVGQSR